MARPETPVDQNTGRPVTFDHLRKKRPARQTVDIVFDQDEAQDYNEVVAKLEVAEQRVEAAKRLDDNDRAERLQAEADELRALAVELADQLRANGSVVEFVFEAIGAHAYDELVRAHPVTAEQEATADRLGLDKPNWNPDTFLPELIALSCVAPTMTVDEVHELFKSSSWNPAELQQLSNAAILANIGRAVVDLGKGSGRTPRTEPRSATS